MTDTVYSISDFIPGEPKIATADRLAAYRVTGKDRAEFLQGQLSNDVNGLEAVSGRGAAQLTSYSNPKGRVLAIMRLVRIQDDWWLLLEADVADKVMPRLKMFVLRSDVQFEKDENFGSVVVVGHDARKYSTDGSLAQSVAHLEIPGALPRIELFGPRETLPAATASADDLQCWNTLSGMLQITPEQCEQHVAQMLNLDRLGAIHFRKGCYAGQEIIARMHYLGKLKKRALPISCNSGNVGDDIFEAEGKKAGTILQSSDAQDGKHGRLHLAMLNLSALDAELKLADDSPVMLLDTGLGHVGESVDATHQA